MAESTAPGGVCNETILIISKGDTVVIPGAGGGLGHLAIQIGGKGMGFRMIVSSRIKT